MSQTSAFRSAFPVAGGPITPEEILAFHRSMFGDARMDNGGQGAADGGSNGGDGAGAGGPGGGTGAAGSAGAPAAGNEKFTDPETGDTFEFPVGKPTREMTDAQRAEYWRHKARKHEKTASARGDYDDVVAERDKYKAAAQTDTEKAIEAAKAAGAAEARATLAASTVAAHFRGELKGVRTDEEITTLVESIDPTKYLTQKGDVDTDKVKATAALWGGGSNDRTWPDTGGGRRGTGARTAGERGKAEAERRFGKPDKQ